MFHQWNVDPLFRNFLHPLLKELELSHIIRYAIVAPLCPHIITFSFYYVTVLPQVDSYKAICPRAKNNELESLV